MDVWNFSEYLTINSWSKTLFIMSWQFTKLKYDLISKLLIMKFLHVLICLAIFMCNLTHSESEKISRNKYYNEKFGSKTKYLITNGIKMTHRLFYAKLSSDYFQFCGATVLHEHFVITAGHCVYHLERELNEWTNKENMNSCKKASIM